MPSNLQLLAHVLPSWSSVPPSPVYPGEECPGPGLPNRCVSHRSPGSCSFGTCHSVCLCVHWFPVLAAQRLLPGTPAMWHGQILGRTGSWGLTGHVGCGQDCYRRPHTRSTGFLHCAHWTHLRCRKLSMDWDRIFSCPAAGPQACSECAGRWRFGWSEWPPGCRQHLQKHKMNLISPSLPLVSDFYP